MGSEVEVLTDGFQGGQGTRVGTDSGSIYSDCEGLCLALSENVDHIFGGRPNFYRLLDVVTEIIDSS